MKIRYIDGPRLRRALLAACEHAHGARAELNRINVFPVPDGDTGTNLALTVGSVAERLRGNRDRAVGDVARHAADAGILGARGNCGMILSHFLIGFAEPLQEHARVGARELRVALENGVRHLYQALERPIEGTMLTVMREAAEEARTSQTADVADLFESILDRARDALARTPDLLPALRRAGVVDAGAKGFVELLEGVGALIHGDPIIARTDMPSYDSQPAAGLVEFPGDAEQHRFCTEALVRGDALPPADTIKDALRDWGDSMIVIRSGDVLKVHIHTDDPEQIFTHLRSLGRLVSHKAEDMQAQHDVVERAAAGHVGLARRAVVIVTDSACDLPAEVVQAHGIRVVPLSLLYEDRALRDGVDIDPATFVERLRAGEHPTTSQPPPAAFHQAFRAAAEEGEAIVGVLLASALSGTYASAQAAAKLADQVDIHLVDSRGASLTQGMLALRAAELAELGHDPEDIIRELSRIRDRSSIFFTVDTFDRLLASGRVGRGRAWLGGLLDIKPILRLDRSGAVHPADKVRGRKALIPKLMDILISEIPSDVESLRFGIVHVDAEEVVGALQEALRQRFGERDTIVAPATPVIATHLGRGAWGLAYQIED